MLVFNRVAVRGEKRKQEHISAVMVAANTGHLTCVGTLLSVFYMLMLNSHTSSTDRHSYLSHRNTQKLGSEKLRNSPTVIRL